MQRRLQNLGVGSSGRKELKVVYNQIKRTIIDKQNQSTKMALNFKYSENKSENLEKIQLQELFEESKRIISHLKKQNSEGVHTELNGRLSAVLHHTYTKLSYGKDLDLRSYIGFMSIYSYIRSSSQMLCNSLNFQNMFYRNLNKNAMRIYEVWKKNEGTPLQEPSFMCLSTLLFILCTFIEAEEKYLQDLKKQKIFNRGLIKTILSMQLPDNSRILKNYRNLLLYIFRNNPSFLCNQQALESIVQNLNNSSSSQETQITIIYMIYKLLDRQSNSGAKIMRKAIPKLKDVLLKTTQISTMKLVLKVIEKILIICPQESFNMTNKQILCFVEKNIRAVDRISQLGPLIEKNILSMQEEGKRQLLKKTLQLTYRVSALQIVNLCLTKISFSFVMQLLENGSWSKITQQFLKQKTNRDYKKKLLIKIMSNVFSQVSSKSIKQAMRNCLEGLSINIFEYSGDNLSFIS